MKYYVRWEVEVTADSPKDAARTAATEFFLAMNQLDPIVEVSEFEIGVSDGIEQFDVAELRCSECSALYCDCDPEG